MMHLLEPTSRSMELLLSARFFGEKVELLSSMKTIPQQERPLKLLMEINSMVHNYWLNSPMLPQEEETMVPQEKLPPFSSETLVSEPNNGLSKNSSRIADRFHKSESHLVMMRGQRVSLSLNLAQEMLLRKL